MSILPLSTIITHNKYWCTQACRERVKALQIKISARNERIKLLAQRGTPDLDPLDT